MISGIVHTRPVQLVRRLGVVASKRYTPGGPVRTGLGDPTARSAQTRQVGLWRFALYFAFFLELIVGGGCSRDICRPVVASQAFGSDLHLDARHWSLQHRRPSTLRPLRNGYQSADAFSSHTGECTINHNILMHSQAKATCTDILPVYKPR